MPDKARRAAMAGLCALVAGLFVVAPAVGAQTATGSHAGSSDMSSSEDALLDKILGMSGHSGDSGASASAGTSASRSPETTQPDRQPPDQPQTGSKTTRNKPETADQSQPVQQTPSQEATQTQLQKVIERAQAGRKAAESRQASQTGGHPPGHTQNNASGRTQTNRTGPAAVAQTEQSQEDLLPAIVVTAEKTALPLTQVPASVSTMSGDFIKKSGATKFADLQGYTANAMISLDPGGGQFSVRGFTTPDSNPGFDPSVGTVIDGVFYGRSGFLSAFFYDIAHFTLLRGPQGTLFGKNASAGLFVLKTAKPQRQRLLGGQIEVGGYGGVSFEPVMQMPVGDKAAIRVAAKVQHGDPGILYNTALNRGEHNLTQNSVRVRWRYQPLDSLTFDVEGFYAHQHMNNGIFQLVRVTPSMAKLFRQYDPKIEFGADNFTTSLNYPAENETEVYGVDATVQYDFEPTTKKEQQTLKFITSYGEQLARDQGLDADFSPVPFIKTKYEKPSPYRQFTEELHLSGKERNLFGFGHELDYVVGVFFSHSIYQITNRFALQNLDAALRFELAANTGSGSGQLPPALGGLLGGILGSAPSQELVNKLTDLLNDTNIINDQFALSGLDQVDQSYAFYGQLMQFVLPNWAVILGVRFGYEHKSGEAFSQTNGGAIQLIPLISDQNNFRQHVSQAHFHISPKLGLKWSPGTGSSAYFTWTVGYKSGGFNGIALNADSLSYGPERASSYELGYKTLAYWLGRPLRFSGDLYWTNFDNLQVSTLHGTTFEVLNAAAARSRGFELSMDWLPFRHASIHLSAGLADAIYTSYPDAPGTIPSGKETQDLSGKPLAFAPRWSASLIPGYTFSLPYTLKAHLYFDVLFKSGRYLGIDDDRANKYQPPTTTYNLRLTFNDSTKNWSLGLTLHNLTDEAILDQVVNVPQAPGNFAATRRDRGRYFSATMSYNFH